VDIFLTSPIQTDSASRSSEPELDFRGQFPPHGFDSLPYNYSVPRQWPSDIHIDTSAEPAPSHNHSAPRQWPSDIHVDTSAEPAPSQYPVWLGYSATMEPSPAFANQVSGQYHTSYSQQHSPSHLSPVSASVLPPGYPTCSLGPLQPMTPPSTPYVNSSPGGSGGSPFSSSSVDLPQVSGPVDSKAKLYSHHEQVQFFKQVATAEAAGPGPFVQQRMYKPHTNSDRRRYVEDVDLEFPIMFWTEHPDQCGIPLDDALHSRVKRLVGRDETVFEGRGPSVSIRLEWPGYRQWSRQIPTKDFRSPPGPITRAKLAKNVAKCVSRFISEKQHCPLEEDADERWRVGNNTGHGQIKLDDLILVSLHHVSMGSWQPQLKLRRSLH